MNRDDHLSRPAAIPPKIYRVTGIRAVYPSEHPVGTWLAANEFGVTLALLNWDRPKVTPKLHSRGGVIPALISAASIAAVEKGLGALEVHGVWPFRLLGFFGRDRRVREWRWDGLLLAARSHSWRRTHWFSSGLSDFAATRHRRRIFDAAADDAAAGTVSWLRRLHRQHGSAPGPFSVCVHRVDAATLSYTEIVLNRSRLSMRYAAGPPCTSLRNGKLVKIDLRISNQAEMAHA